MTYLSFCGYIRQQIVGEFDYLYAARSTAKQTDFWHLNTCTDAHIHTNCYYCYNYYHNEKALRKMQTLRAHRSHPIDAQSPRWLE